MIFLTVGTQFGFDRLVRAVDNAMEQGLIQEEIFAQIGPGKYLPQHMNYVDFLEKEIFDQKVRQAEIVISHAGIGSLMLAFDHQKPILIVPRQKKFGEVVNDHQVATARKFEELGHVLAAYDTNDIAEKIRHLKTFIPKPRTPRRQGVIDRIATFLSELTG